MKKQIIITLICLAMLPGCDDSEPDFREHYVSKNLVIGDMNAPGLVYVDLSPDSVIDPQRGEQDVISLDMNGDGGTALLITSNLNNSESVFTFSNSGISGFGIAEISYESVSQTVYQYTETINDSVEIHHYENSSAAQPQNSSITNVQGVYPAAYHAGDTIADNITLWTRSVDLTRQTIGVDTTNSNRYYVYDLRLGKWSGAGVRYAGFRFIKARDVYYGWIKLEVTDYTKIVVYEYAYRKITEI